MGIDRKQKVLVDFHPLSLTKKYIEIPFQKLKKLLFWNASCKH